MGACMSLKRYSEQIFVENESIQCALYSNQGRRNSMEDRHVISLSLPQHKSYSLYGVFDGFNGDHAAIYLSQNISQILDALTDLEDNEAIINGINQMDSKWINTHDDIHTSNINAAGTTFVLLLVNRCSEHANTDETSSSSTDVQLQEALHSSTSIASCTNTPVSKNEAEPLKCGYFPEQPSSLGEKGYKVRVFWAGDSRAVLMSKEGAFKNLTVDHHCAVDEERKRIINANGVIINNRIDGVCEVTRGFGCYPMKNNKDLSKDEQKMSAIAEYNEIYCGKDDKLLIFCDGVLKKWSENRFKRNCQHFILQYEQEQKGLLYGLMYLSEQVMHEGSPDNITIMSLKFK